MAGGIAAPASTVKTIGHRGAGLAAAVVCHDQTCAVEQVHDTQCRSGWRGGSSAALRVFTRSSASRPA